MLDNNLPIKKIHIILAQFQTCFNSGLSAERILNIVGDDPELGRTGKKLKKAANEINQGKTLTMALRSNLRYELGDFFISMINIAEETGTYSMILKQMDELYDNYHQLSSKLKSQFLFPSLAIGLFIVVQIYLNMFVAIIFSVGLVSFLFIWKNFPSTVKNRLITEIFLTIPPFRGAYRQLCVILFLKTYAVVYSSGFHPEKTKILILKLFPYTFIRNPLKKCFDSMSSGKTLNESFINAPFLSPVEKSSFSIGEIAGNVEALLNKTAEMSMHGLTIKVETTLKLSSQFAMLAGSLITGISLYLLLTSLIR